MEQPKGGESEALFIRDQDGVAHITESGYKLLELHVTDTKGSVFAVRETLGSSLVSAAMARLSRCGDDFRVILLNEMIESIPRQVIPRNMGKEIPLLQRIITAYGDDSVQQLGSFYVVVQNCSNILTKVLERCRIGANFIETSTRFIQFDILAIVGWNSDGSPIIRYRYHIPSELQGEDLDFYAEKMERLFKNYSNVVRQLQVHLAQNSSVPEEKRDAAWRTAIRAQACDSARFLLPAATLSTVGISASAQCFDNLIMHLLGHELAEARDIGTALLRELRKVAPVFFERTDLPDRGGATTAYLRETRDKFREVCNQFGGTIYTRDKPVRLSGYYPQLEQEIIPALGLVGGVDLEMYDEYPDGLLDTLLEAYVGERLNRRHRNGRILEMVHYSFFFHTGYAEFRDMQRHRVVDAFEWSLLRWGDDFEVPEAIKAAGLEKEFSESFDLSLRLCEMMNYQYGAVLEQYATLFGHKMDWTWTVNLRELMHIIELRTQPAGHPAYRKLCQQMYDEVQRVHPRFAALIKFINKGDDPELSRLAAERATAFKLSKMQ